MQMQPSTHSILAVTAWIGTPRVCCAVPLASAFVSATNTIPSSHTTAAEPTHVAVAGAGLGEGLGLAAGGAADVGAGDGDGAFESTTVPSEPSRTSAVVVAAGGAGGEVGDVTVPPVPSGIAVDGMV